MLCIGRRCACLYSRLAPCFVCICGDADVRLGCMQEVYNAVGREVKERLNYLAAHRPVRSSLLPLTPPPTPPQLAV